MTQNTTGQPTTTDELMNATQSANASLSEMLANGEIERGFDDEDEGDDADGGSEDTMAVTDFDGETHTYTPDEWAAARTRTRLWGALERRGGVYVRVAHWFTDSDVNAVTTGDGFYGRVVAETDDARKFEADPSAENHTAATRTFWMPKTAARVYTLTTDEDSR